MVRDNETYKGIELKQVNKTKARRLFNEGVTVYLLASNMRLNNPWTTPHDINKSMYDMDYESFDKIVNAFEYYNCNNGMGSYSHFMTKA